MISSYRGRKSLYLCTRNNRDLVIIDNENRKIFWDKYADACAEHRFRIM
jgi:hypothetical protein